MRSLAEALGTVKDHRQRQGLRHKLQAILLFMCTGMLCGCRSLQALTVWGKRQDKALLQLLGFPRGLAPGYGTLQRTAKQLNVASFEAALSEWAEEVFGQYLPKHSWQGVALDGKVIRGSRDGDVPGVHVLALLAHELGITLDQGPVPRETNEHKASLPLLQGFRLSHRVITADAAFMQREVCGLIRQRQGRYLIVLKDNQPDLAQTVQDWFEPFPPPDEFQMQAAEQYGLGHGRIERRRLWALPMYDDFIDWPGARTLLRLERTFTHKRTGTKSVELDYALSSLGLDQITAADFLALWQAHWHSENKLHWIRDVTLNEDASRVRSGNAPQVLAAIRNTLITAARRAGFTNIAEALRAFAQSPF